MRKLRALAVARWLPTWEAQRDNPKGAWHGSSFVEPKQTYRSLKSGLRVAHVGKEASYIGGYVAEMGTGDTHSESFLLSGRPGSWTTLRMSFTAARRDFKVSAVKIRAQIMAEEPRRNSETPAISAPESQERGELDQ